MCDTDEADVRDGKVSWLVHQLGRPECCAVFDLSDSELVAVMLSRLYFPSQRQYLTGRAGNGKSALGRSSFVTGSISASVPHKVDLHACLEHELFGYFQAKAMNNTMVRPRLRGTIQSNGQTSTLSYRIDGFATALTALVLTPVALLLVVAGLYLHMFGNPQWNGASLAIALVGVLVAGFPLTIITRTGSAIKHDQILDSLDR